MLKSINGGKLPTKGSKYSACVDLFTNIDITIEAGQTKLIPLGICLDYDNFPIYLKNNMKSHYLQLMLRSSIGKKGLIMPNGVGIIDIDFKDEIKLIVYNPLIDGAGYENISFSIPRFKRIAQITILEHKSYLFGIDTSTKRTGGFGSTDKKDDVCGFCGGNGYITVAGNHDIHCSECS